ncbi:MAG: tRNA (adenosine(37)-N6)-dimethylallyltransferase MiaA, partial [Parvularculaceae bacterium]
TGGEIVNADALQVYRDLKVLSARPGAEEEARAPHHLFGFLDAAVACSAGLWSRLAAEAISGIAARGRLAILVGGTGLYFRALSEGLSPIPDIADNIRERVRRRRVELGSEAFHADLVARDPASACLVAGDAQRLLRAAEVLEATGRPLSYFQAMRREPLIAAPLAALVIEPERAALYRIAEARFDAMLSAGAVDEARALLSRSLDPALPAMKALGAAELMAHLRGEMTLAEAVLLAKRNTRRFVKRQLTWFRNQTPGWMRALDARSAVEMLASNKAIAPLAP